MWCIRKTLKCFKKWPITKLKGVELFHTHFSISSSVIVKATSRNLSFSSNLFLSTFFLFLSYSAGMIVVALWMYMFLLLVSLICLWIIGFDLCSLFYLFKAMSKWEAVEIGMNKKPKGEGVKVSSTIYLNLVWCDVK